MCTREIALGLDVNVIKANELVFMSNGPEWEGFGVFGRIGFGMSWDNICLIKLKMVRFEIETVKVCWGL